MIRRECLQRNLQSRSRLKRRRRKQNAVLTHLGECRDFTPTALVRKDMVKTKSRLQHTFVWLWQHRVVRKSLAGNSVPVRPRSAAPGATAPPIPSRVYLRRGIFLPRCPKFRYTFCNAITGATAPPIRSRVYLRRGIFCLAARRAADRVYSVSVMASIIAAPSRKPRSKSASYSSWASICSASVYVSSSSLQ